MSVSLLNHLTARPLLELLLAQLEYESGYLFLEPTWPVFLWWAALPTQQDDDGVSFQATLESEGPDGILLTVSILRQLTYPAPALDARERCGSRQVGVQWTYELGEVGALVERDIWARDFPSLEAFAYYVKRLPEWQLAAQRTGLEEGGSVVQIESGEGPDSAA